MFTRYSYLLPDRAALLPNPTLLYVALFYRWSCLCRSLPIVLHSLVFGTFPSSQALVFPLLKLWYVLHLLKLWYVLPPFQAPVCSLPSEAQYVLYLVKLRYILHPLKLQFILYPVPAYSLSSFTLA